MRFCKRLSDRKTTSMASTELSGIAVREPGALKRADKGGETLNQRQAVAVKECKVGVRVMERERARKTAE